MIVDTVSSRQRPARIMLVEDHSGDVLLTRRAFRSAKIANELFVATCGEEAISMLNKEGKFSDTPLPDIILLDLNLPRMSGQE
ncbi:MAG: response regulator, partial [Alphaproteobacteria bacterium]